MFAYPIGRAKRSLPVHARPNLGDFGIGLWFVHQVSPIAWQRDWRLIDCDRRPAGRAPRQASETPVFCALHEIRTQCISLDVAHDGQQVVVLLLVLLYQERLESSLPDSTCGAVLCVLPPDVARKRPLSPACKVAGLLGPHHQVEVIGHDAGRKEWDVNPILGAVNQGQELLVVGGLVKYAGLLVAAIENVVAVVCNDEAGGTWHPAKLRHAPSIGWLHFRRLGPITQACPRLLGNGECPH